VTPRARWRLLFGAALMGLVGVSWVAQRYGARHLGLATLPVIGMLVAVVVAFAAMVASARSRGLAWVVLACWVPAGADVVRALGWIGAFLAADGVAAVVLIVGAVATLGTGLWIALAPARCASCARAGACSCRPPGE
jgi:hypothetical protein